MRVAFVSLRTVHDRETALTRRISRTAESLARRGHDVSVLCSRWWDGNRSTFVSDGVEYRAVTAGPAEGSFSTKLPGALWRVDPDVIHAVHVPPSQVIAAAVGRLLTRAPLVVDWYDGRNDDGDRLWNRAAQMGDAIVAPSRLVKTDVRSLGTNGDRVTVVPDSIDMSLVRETEPAGDADIVYSRHLDADANVEILQLALAELRDRDWRATIVGDGPERHRYERQARDLRIEDRVDFVGDLPLEERIALFKRAHVFVQTARRSSFANELLWALACGCVGVVEYQALSSAHELIEHCDRGYRTTSDHELTDRIVAAGELPHQEVNEEFARYDHDAVLDQYLDCYRTVRDEFGVL